VRRIPVVGFLICSGFAWEHHVRRLCQVELVPNQPGLERDVPSSLRSFEREEFKHSIFNGGSQVLRFGLNHSLLTYSVEVVTEV